jgi:hypothetical protein
MVEKHNSGQWLRVEYLSGSQHGRGRGRGYFGYRPGWYVTRICPCHPGVPVTCTLASEARPNGRWSR